MAKEALKMLVAEQKILNRIYAIRGQRVMLDEDLRRNRPNAFTELCKALHNSVYVNKKIM